MGVLFVMIIFRNVNWRAMVITCSVNSYLFNTEKVNSKYDNQIALNLHNNNNNNNNNATIVYNFL